jgi:hypothetical protein
MRKRQLNLGILLTSYEHLSAGTLFDEGWGVSVNWSVFVGFDGTTFVNGLTNNINNSSKSLGTDWNQDRVTGIQNWLSSNETFSGVESDGSHVVATQVLGDFEDESVGYTLDLKSVKNWGKLTFELHVDDGTNNLRNLSMSDLCAEATYTTQIVKSSVG